jgi:hypothetical protein
MANREAMLVQALKDLYHQTRPLDPETEELLFNILDAYAEAITTKEVAHWLDLAVSEVEALYRTYRDLQNET